MSKKKPLKMKKEAKTILTKRGYAIVKKRFHFTEIDKCKKDLTVKPYVKEDDGAKPTPFTIYLERSKKLYLPKHYGLEKFGEPDQVKITKGIEINLEFKGQLRPKQTPIVQAFLKSTDNGTFHTKSNGGIISVPCGWGKTIIALNLISKLKRKTIIIVHKGFLLNQWEQRIKEFLPGAKIGRIQGPTIDIDGKDIVIAMLQSISMKDYDTSVFEDFGFTIVDECHHIAAEVFSRSLPKINSYYSLGLSATPNRADGLQTVFAMFLGPMLYRITSADDKKVLVKVIEYNDNNASNNNLNEFIETIDKISNTFKITDNLDKKKFINSDKNCSKLIQKIHSKSSKLNKNLDNNIDNINIILCTCIYKRPELTKFCLGYWIKQNFSKIIITYSLDSDYNNLLDYHDNEKVIFIKYSNFPISKKWNRCILEVKKYPHNAVMIIGSDDIVLSSYLKKCKQYIKNDYDYISNTKWYNIITNSNLLFSLRYILRKKYDGIGSGRVINKKILEKYNYSIYNFNRNRGLDGTSFLIFEESINKIAYDICNFVLICIDTKPLRDGITKCDLLKFISMNYRNSHTQKTIDYIYNISNLSKDSLQNKK